MNVGVVLPLFSGDPAKVLDVARRAEAAGYDGVFAFDHFFPPGAPPERPSLEAFGMLSAVAASTSRVAVGTLVARASLRPVGLLAKLAANVDLISSGRMILGVGTGDPIDEPEHDAFGLPYLGKAERRVHLVETVRALAALFRAEAWPGGRLVPRIAGPLLPPARAPSGPPVWIGGFADAVVRLAAREADAWNGWGMAVPEFAAKARLLGEAASAAGRDVEATWAGIVVAGRDDEEAGRMLDARYRRGMLETSVWAGGVDALARWFGALADVGATWAILVPAGGPERLELIAETVLPRTRERG